MTATQLNMLDKELALVCLSNKKRKEKSWL
jgi:hypothetical protein